jgi:hypothetical protein
MSCTLKEAAVKRCHYDNQLQLHLHGFIQAYHFARHLKTLQGLMPYEYLCKIGTTQPERFVANPIPLMTGLNT